MSTILIVAVCYTLRYTAAEVSMGGLFGALVISGSYYFPMAKYPITYAPYELFVSERGYTIRTYWTDAGWAWKGARTQSYQFPEDIAVEGSQIRVQRGERSTLVQAMRGRRLATIPIRVIIAVMMDFGLRRFVSLDT